MSASAEPEQRATGAGKRIIFQSAGLKSYAENHPILVVRWQSRTGGEFLTSIFVTRQGSRQIDKSHERHDANE
jgi:hypothetical protein